MNKYLLLKHGTASASGDAWPAYFKMLEEGDYIIGGAALNDGIAVENGAFSNAITSTLTGYIVVQAPDLETAKQLMLQSPVHQSGGTVELFELV